MKKLDKYFLKNFFITWVVIFFSFSLIFLSLQVNFYYARYFKYLHIKEYIYLTLFTFLNILPIILPITFLLSLGYLIGKWAFEKKVLSFKVLGFSFSKLNKIFIFLAFLFSFFLSIYYLFTLPFLRKRFDIFLEEIFKKNYIYSLKPNRENKFGKICFYFKKRENLNFYFVKLKYNNITLTSKKASFLFKNDSLYLEALEGNVFSKNLNMTFKKANLEIFKLKKNFFSLKLKRNLFELLKNPTFSSQLELFVRITISLSVLSVGLYLLKSFYNKTIFDIKYGFKFAIFHIILFYTLYTIFYIISKRTFLPILVLFPNIIYFILFFITKEI